MERHQDLAVGGTHRHVVAEGHVDGIRHPDVVRDHGELALGNHLPDVVLHPLEVAFRLLDPGPGRRPHVEP